MEINQHATEQPVGQRRIQMGNKKIPWDKSGNVTYKSYRMQKSSSKRKVHSNKCLFQETKIILNRWPTAILQGTRKRKTKKAQT